ncbi:MAG: Smr/MutS family protein [Alphaproteobacteria bacterium]|nr:Smr/MutS family protein [Alphaproteobacteria bacterium]
MARGGPPKKQAPPKNRADQDRDLWAAVTRNVRPLEDRPREARGLRHGESEPAERTSEGDAARLSRRLAHAAAQASAPPPPPREPPPALAPGSAPGLDRRTAERLRRGKLAIDGRVDLHGMSRDAAHRTVIDHLSSAHLLGKRCVLVVTGKGRGILKESVPHWLNLPPLREKILAIETARPEHGGEGALYVLLKRRRDRDGGP